MRKSWTLVTPKLEENGVKFFLKVFEVGAVESLGISGLGLIILGWDHQVSIRLGVSEFRVWILGAKAVFRAVPARV